MKYDYKVETFVPTVKGCGATDQGWDEARCGQFQSFLNERAAAGYKLHSMEYRETKGAAGCLGQTTSVTLVCVFERPQG